MVKTLESSGWEFKTSMIYRAAMDKGNSKQEVMANVSREMEILRLKKKF